jgi:hypothetical protein
MKKLTKDGKVAVLYSPDFGAGWYSWHAIEELLYDPSIVTWVESGELDKIEAYVTLKWPEVYLGALSNLTVAWIPIGTKFRIEEYDGNESVVIEGDDIWFTA